MNLWLFSSSTSNMVLGRAWVTTASTTTASSFGASPSGLLVRRRAERRGLRLGVEDLAKTLSLRPYLIARTAHPGVVGWNRAYAVRGVSQPSGRPGRLAEA